MELESRLNIEISDLVSLVSKSPDVPSQTKPNDFIGIPIIAKLGQVKNITRSMSDGYDNSIEMYKNSIGLKRESYSRLQKIANELIEMKPYSDFATIGFIVKHLFDWIIETYHNNRVKIEPLDYLRNCFDSECQDYNFYFRVISLGIKKPFKIGLVELTFLQEDFLAIQYEKFKKELKDRPKEEFEKFFSEFISRPIAKITCRGIKDKAEQKAKRQVNLAIDALKSFLAAESLDSSSKMLDVEYRFIEITRSLHIYDSKSEVFDFDMSFNANDGIKPISLDNQKVNNLFDTGLWTVSYFIAKEKSNELYKIILELVTQIGNYSSERNLYIRVVKIISVYESIFLPQRKGKGRGLSILKTKVIEKIIDEDEKSMIRKIFIDFYNIRDKYLHNGIEKYINLDDLFILQNTTTYLLLILIQLNETLTTTKELLDYFNIKTK